MPSMKGFHALRHLPEEKITDKISRRVLVGDKEMVVWWSMKAGAHAAAHAHPHEQIFWLISGTMEFRLGGEQWTCRAGDGGGTAPGDWGTPSSVAPVSCAMSLAVSRGYQLSCRMTVTRSSRIWRMSAATCCGDGGIPGRSSMTPPSTSPKALQKYGQLS